MDFYQLRTKETKSGNVELYPGFTVGRSTDLMVRGGDFYAIWDEKNQLWSTDEYDVARLVDEELFEQAAKMSVEGKLIVKDMKTFESNTWSLFKKFVNQVGDNSHQLDQNLTFANTEVKKTDYVSRKLPYSLGRGDISAWDELVGTLYSVDNRAKIEWVIGAIVSGDSKYIQKFAVFYGAPGTGKGTILDIVERLFPGYTTTFDAKALGSNGNQFATEAFRHNPLIALQQDGDLSRIADNTRLNSIISHENMTMNVKFQSAYTARVNAFLLLGTNQPVKISDAKSGIIRRLIDIHPTGVKIPVNRYNTLMSKTDFELGAIAQHCLDVYNEMGKNYYNSYRPLEMMLQTDVFFNFIEAYYDVFKAQDGATLSQAYLLYKEYCAESSLDRILPKYLFREELRNYFDNFRDRAEVDGHLVRSYYEGFNANKFKAPTKEPNAFSLVIEETTSLFDEMAQDWPAQTYRTHPEMGDIPEKYWTDEPRMIGGEIKPPRKSQVASTTLADLNTAELHFVKVPLNHIVIDFDLVDETTGKKSLERNLDAASNFPATYAELSKSGEGVHLHYHYDGDVTELANQYSEGIEIKTLLGDSSLRRRLTKCNHTPVATLSSGLPLKEKKKVLPQATMQTEKSIRNMVIRNLHKEIHPGTKPSIDFIKKILDDAYNNGVEYDLQDMRNKIMAFANNSSNQPMTCLKTVSQMKFKGKDPEGAEAVKGVFPDNDGPPWDTKGPDVASHSVTSKNQQAHDAGFKKDAPLVFWDVEVYPNLFVVCWMYEDSDEVVEMINPTPVEIEPLMSMRLVGFNNRRYDNHILYGRYMGLSNEELYRLSQKIINNETQSMFGEAYRISYADIYDFTSKKQSLKKYEIELGITHIEMDLPWDEPVADDKIAQVAKYCSNDVRATKATFESRKQDFVARQILADLSGLSVNDPTPKHTARIIFGTERNPQTNFVYTELDKEFPGYVFDAGKSHYRDELVGEGGYVYAEPGVYDNVAVLDIASMHPTTIEQLNYFGEYTPKFAALKAARVAIKHGDYDSARGMLDGKLAPYLGDENDAEALSYALKIVINIVYGLTAARFDNPFKHIRNKDNIVAKRGALFMIDLKHAVQEQGFQVIHIKTDSIKIPNATPEIIEFVTNYGAKYGYDFEHEATYDRIALVNDAVYIAKYGWAEKAKKIGTWDATGAQFQHPYVYKTLFTGETPTFDDMCETKQVAKGSIHMDFDHDTPMSPTKEGLKFVGRIGRFVPVQEDQKGAVLYRIADDKHYAVTGTKGHLWVEADMAQIEDPKIDMTYFDKLVQNAKDSISKYRDFEEFIK